MDHAFTRREMIQASVLLLGGVCSCRMAGDAGAPRCTCCNSPDLEAESLTVNEDHLAIDLTKAVSLGDVGNAAWITHEGKGLKLIVVRSGKDEYCVLSRLCTHGGQTVSYNRKRRLLQCNNYNHSNFGLDGRVVKGPAPTPLKSYAVTRVENTLVVAI
ncbi:MAG TPA: Rieske 2Fe-2S domain-containing protein [Sedimentisphaerales bacterium]|nr:Rieske 2Fe-2S domain-containing protein [Sedimentisphaerales bacterium]